MHSYQRVNSDWLSCICGNDIDIVKMVCLEFLLSRCEGLRAEDVDAMKSPLNSGVSKKWPWVAQAIPEI